MASLSWPGYDKLIAKLAKLKDPDLMPVMEQWRATVIEGNRRGVLQGVDGYGRPMPALKYRNGTRAPKTRNRRVPDYGTTRHAATINDNLTTREYQQLTGPRLAPRGEQSRIIKNLFVDIAVSGGTPRRWGLRGGWFEVRGRDGTEFLPVHFLGLRAGRGAGFIMPRYDLRRVRDEDRQLCRNALKAFVRQAWNASL